MSLLVSIKSSGSFYTYTLKAENVDHMFTRFAAQSPIPASPGTSGSGSVFVLDLGQLLEQVTINGTVDTISSTSGQPTKAQLEEVCRTWWGYTNYGSYSNQVPQLIIDSGQVYLVSIKQASFRRLAGQEDRWDYSMVFLIAGKT